MARCDLPVTDPLLHHTLAPTAERRLGDRY